MVQIEQLKLNEIYKGDALGVLKTFPSESVDCVVTSPPYWALRDYGVEGQLGLEPTVAQYVERLCAVFDEVRRVLKSTGTCWVNIGDTYAGANAGSRWNTGQKLPCDGGDRKLRSLAISSSSHVFEHVLPEKCLTQIPSRFAIAMCDRGWILRNEIIWHKPNCMPASVKDRFTVDFEKLFFFVKTRKYYFNQIVEQGSEIPGKVQRIDTAKRFGRVRNMEGRTYTTTGTRNKRAVWSICNGRCVDAHFAVFPESLVETPLRAGCPPGGVILDPFLGTGTTAVAALRQQKHFVGIELNPAYIEIAKARLRPLIQQVPRTAGQCEEGPRGTQGTLQDLAA